MSEPTTTDPTTSDDADESLGGSGLAAEKARRLGQVDAMRAAGNNPYPYRFDRTGGQHQHRGSGVNSVEGVLPARKFERGSLHLVGDEEK